MSSFTTSIGTEACGDTPAGALTAYCGNFAFSSTNQIDGWVLCDGTTYDNTSGKYNSLINLSIGTGTLSSGNYTPPNLSGRMPLGRTGSTINTMNTGGANNHTLTVAEYPSHNHTVTSVSGHTGIADHTHSYVENINVDANNASGAFASDGDNRNPMYNTGNSSNSEHTHNNFSSGNVINNLGIGQPFSVLNQHVGVKWILKY